jgi:hypothetical protein
MYEERHSKGSRKRGWCKWNSTIYSHQRTNFWFYDKCHKLKGTFLIKPDFFFDDSILSGCYCTTPASSHPLDVLRHTHAGIILISPSSAVSDHSRVPKPSVRMSAYFPDITSAALAGNTINPVLCPEAHYPIQFSPTNSGEWALNTLLTLYLFPTRLKFISQNIFITMNNHCIVLYPSRTRKTFHPRYFIIINPV